MKTQRRKLTFAFLEDVSGDVENLLAGHVTLGRWSLGQICNHLALTIRLSMEGVPVKFPWLLRRTFGAAARRISLSLGWIPAGVRVPSVYLPQQSDLNGVHEAELLRNAIASYRKFSGELDEHPLLGRLSSAEWEHFHRLHCAHHLSFALPLNQQGGASSIDKRFEVHRSGQPEA